jgi:hypothetical protein
MWAAMKGHTEVVKLLIKFGADVKAKEKVRRRYRVITWVGANDQLMLGTGLPDNGAAERECSCQCTVPVVLSRGLTDDCHILCAKCTTYLGPDGSLLVLQRVSIADL